MSAVHEALGGLVWIQSTLAASTSLMTLATGGVWRDQAPVGTLPSYIIVGHQAGSDITTVNGVRIIVESLYQVRILGPAANTAVLASAGALIDTLIGNPPASGAIFIGGVFVGQVLSSHRQAPILLSEDVAGKQWSSVGGLYRIITQSA